MLDVITKLRILRIYLGEAYESWRSSVWVKDLDAAWCCDGRECCCGAMTIREAHQFDARP